MKTILVTGGAGFIGSHLCDRLIENGNQVYCVDNFITGSRENVSRLLKNKRFKLIEADVAQVTDKYLSSELQFDEIYHLASPASPKGYQDAPIETYKVNSFGTHHLIKLAKKQSTKFLFASTSEAYGEPLEHPQKETYWGNVNSLGVRACYDESKRFGEMVCMTHYRKFNLDIRIVRIFNTYGPHMDPSDGRVIPNFVTQALKGKPITVYGDGKQTRSFCFVSDMVEGIYKAMNRDQARAEVINLGNPDECGMLDLAKKIKEETNSNSEIVFTDLPEDDPSRRRPDIGKAKDILDWQPTVSFKKGLKETIEYFKKITF